MSTTSSAVFSPGEQIGSYRIIRELDRGGMAIIYEAINESICKRVAIKVLLPELASQEAMVQRFLNEARVINQISHSGLVMIFELGKTENGLWFIVMELLEGVTLGKLLLHLPRIGLPTVLCILQQVASALSATHAQQIIHRDLKPANIFLCRDRAVQGDLRAKVLDFGVAKQIARTGSDSSNGMLTRAGTFLGTPFFVAPEQIHDSSQVTDRADVYSLGIILYQCLTGRLPFTGTSSSVLVGHLQEPPCRLRTLDPAIPVVIDDLCAVMLSKDALSRPTMEEVDRCLGLLLSDMAPTTVRRGTEALFASSLWSIDNAPSLMGAYQPISTANRRRNRVAQLICGVVVLGTATTGSVWWFQSRLASVDASVGMASKRVEYQGASVAAADMAHAAQSVVGPTSAPALTRTDGVSPLAVSTISTPLSEAHDASTNANPILIKEEATVPSRSGRTGLAGPNSTTAVTKARNRSREEPRRPPLLSQPASSNSPSTNRQATDFTDDDIQVHN